MMVLPAVGQTTAKFFRLSVFLETGCCRRSYNNAPRPDDAQRHRRRPHASHPQNVVRHEEGQRSERRFSKPDVEKRPSEVKRKSPVAEMEPRPIAVDSFSSVNKIGPSSLHRSGLQAPTNSNGNAVLTEEEQDPKLDESEDYVEDFKQYPNVPMTKFSFRQYPSNKNISGKEAAIAYLRIRGWANRGRKKTFYAILGWILRHAARDLGYEIMPDGFVRISDLLRFELFRSYKLKSFAKGCTKDMFNRFEVCSLPDLVDGELREVWWARARDSQTIPGVNAANKRIINMGKLQTVVFRAPLKDWPQIQKYGILQDNDRLIRLYHTGDPYFQYIVPHNPEYICITIDAQRAAELGVKFFHTEKVELLAVGRNGALPVEAIRSVVELRINKENLI